MTFTNSNELHEYLNQNPQEISNTDDIVKIIRNSIGQLDEEKDKLAIQNFQLEMAVLSFRIEESSLKPKATFPNEQGQMVSYPSVHGLTKGHFEYIDQVFKSSTSNLIKAHFGHFLWVNGKRHTMYLDNAIAGYTAFINGLLAQNKASKEEKGKNGKYHYVRFLLTQLVFLSQKKRATEDVRQLILKTLNDSDHEFLFYSLALLMLETKKVFKNEDFELLIPMCISYSENLKSPFEKISFFKLGARVDHRQNTTSENWKKLIGQQYELLANERKDLAGITFANKASRYFEEAGEKEAAERMAKLYKEKSDSKELGKVQSEVDITEYVNFIDKVIEELSKKEIKEIIVFLSNNPHVIPHKQFMDDIVESVKENNTMRFYMGNQIYDSNGHIAQHFNSEDEITYMLTLENYNQVIRVRFEVLVNRLFVKLLEREDWTAENLLKVINEESWYGQEIHKPLNSVDTIPLKIIDLIRPGINNYFEELNKFKADNTYEPDFTLSIDSLTLKIEAIFREICILIGVRTFYIRKDNSDREVTKEKDINMLLREEKLIQFLGEDFMLYLKALLVERVGNNLRNKVAHSFLYPIEYKNFMAINKIIIALLKLSIWKITGINDEEE